MGAGVRPRQQDSRENRALSHGQPHPRENDVPDPQMVIGGRSLWSRPVVQEWIETRAYTPEESSKAVSRDFGDGLHAGIADLREKIF
jgi:hypothetical protein